MFKKDNDKLNQVLELLRAEKPKEAQTIFMKLSR